MKDWWKTKRATNVYQDGDWMAERTIWGIRYVYASSEEGKSNDKHR